jgi:cyclic pyranopterin phosphate synthase
MNKLIDQFDREHDYLRLSVTDKCNFRCFYCNPNTAKECNTGKSSLLSYEELLRIISIFSSKFGFKKFRFTGGEPLVRKGFVNFLSDVNELKKKFNFEIGLTTNGFLLSDNLNEIISTGVSRLNISLDTLKKERFKDITKIDVFENVYNAILKAIDSELAPIKINTVIMKGVNDDEILDFVDFVKDKNANVRFIEFMPFSDNNWNKNDFLSFKDMKNIVEQKYKLTPIENSSSDVAKDYSIDGFQGKVSFISSISEHFCSSCNRVRISSKGEFRLCLFSDGVKTVNFKELFRAGLTDEAIVEKLQVAIQSKWEKHPDAKELKEMKSNNMLNIGG